jgi:putative membrane protein
MIGYFARRGENVMKFNGRSLAAISIAALSLASVLPISTAQAQSTTTVAVADVNLNAPRFVQRIGSLNIYLINSSKMALQRSQNEAVRGFAQRLIEHHSAMQHDLAVVNNSNVGGSMPSSMNADDTRRLGDLAGVAAPAFNASYMSNAIVMLDEDLAIAKAQAANGKVESLRKFAAATVAKIDANLREAKTIAGTAGL